jgi:hypothetical protein
MSFLNAHSSLATFWPGFLYINVVITIICLEICVNMCICIPMSNLRPHNLFKAIGTPVVAS